MRYALAIFLLLLITLSGCTGDPTLDTDMDYSKYWDSPANTSYYVQEDFDVTVVEIENKSEIKLSISSALGGEESVRVGAVRYRYRNDSVVNISEIDIGSSATVISLPGVPGELGYVTMNRDGRFHQKTLRDGDVLLELPRDKDARNLFLGGISPSGYNVSSESPLRLYWNDLDSGSTVSIDYYDRNDPEYLIYLLIGLLTTTIAVLFYYRKKFREVRLKREIIEDESKK